MLALGYLLVRVPPSKPKLPNGFLVRLNIKRRGTMLDGMDELGEILRSRRAALGCTQRSLGSELGVNGSHLAMIENGQRKPSLKLVGRLAERLGLNPQQLLVVARPETKPFITATNSESTNRTRTTTGSWQQFINDRALLKRYQATARELQVLKRHFSGSSLSAKEYIAILVLLRDVSERNGNGHFLSVGCQQRTSLEHLQAAAETLLDAIKLSRSKRRNSKTRQITLRTLLATPAPEPTRSPVARLHKRTGSQPLTQT